MRESWSRQGEDGGGDGHCHSHVWWMCSVRSTLYKQLHWRLDEEWETRLQVRTARRPGTRYS